jgi:predicted Zn-dependent peptidase
MKRAFFALALTTIFFFSWAQESVEVYDPSDHGQNPNPGTFSVPYTKKTLSNGMVIITSEDKSDPVVHFNLTYKLGSASAFSDRTPIIYFINQLLFDLDNEYLSGIKKYGKDIHIKTEYDYTIFSFTMPVNMAEHTLWCLSTHLSTFAQNLTLGAFQDMKEKLVQEQNTKKFGSPYGSEIEMIKTNLYAYGHPYSWLVEGKIGHYDGILLNDLKKFYIDWYGSNNLIVTVVGDISAKDMSGKVADYFNIMFVGQDAATQLEKTVSLSNISDQNNLFEERYISYFYEGYKENTPKLTLVYKTVNLFDQNQYYLDFIAYNFNQENSLMHRNLIGDGLAESYEVKHVPMKYGGEFYISVIAKKGVPLKDLKDVILKTISDVYHYPTEEEMREIRNKIIENRKKGEETEELETEMREADSPPIEMFETIFQYSQQIRKANYKGFEKTSVKADHLSMNEFIVNDPKQMSYNLMNKEMIDPKMLMSVGNQYLLNKNPLILSIVPKKDSILIAGTNNYETSQLKTVITHISDEEIGAAIPDVKGKKEPKIKKYKKYSFQDIKTELYENGASYTTIKVENIPMTGFVISVGLKNLPQIASRQVSPYFISKIIETKYKSVLQNEMPKGVGDLSAISFTAYPDRVEISSQVLKEELMQEREIIFGMVFNDRIPFNPDELFYDLQQEGPMQINRKELVESVIARGGFTQGKEGTDFIEEVDIYIHMINKVLESFGVIISAKDVDVSLSGSEGNPETMDMAEGVRNWFPQEVNTGDMPVLPDTTTRFFYFKKEVEQPVAYLNYEIVDIHDAERNAYIEFLNFVLNEEFGFKTSSFVSFGKKYFVVEVNKTDNDVYSNTQEILNIIQQLKSNKFDLKKHKQLKLSYLSKQLVSNESLVEKTKMAMIMGKYSLSSNYFPTKYNTIYKMWRFRFKKETKDVSLDDYRLFFYGDKGQIAKFQKDLGNGVEVDENGVRLN